LGFTITTSMFLCFSSYIISRLLHNALSIFIKFHCMLKLILICIVTASYSMQNTINIITGQVKYYVSFIFSSFNEIKQLYFIIKSYYFLPVVFICSIEPKSCSNTAWVVGRKCDWKVFNDFIKKLLYRLSVSKITFKYFGLNWKKLFIFLVSNLKYGSVHSKNCVCCSTPLSEYINNNKNYISINHNDLSLKVYARGWPMSILGILPAIKCK